MKNIILKASVLFSIILLPAFTFASDIVDVRFKSSSKVVVSYRFDQTIVAEGLFINWPALVTKDKKITCGEVNGKSTAIVQIGVTEHVIRNQVPGQQSAIRKFHFNLDKLCDGVDQIQINGELFSEPQQ